MLRHTDQNRVSALLIFQSVGRQIERRTGCQGQVGVPKLITEEDQHRNQPEDAGAGQEFPVEPGIIEAIESARFFGAAGDLLATRIETLDRRRARILRFSHDHFPSRLMRGSMSG